MGESIIVSSLTNEMVVSLFKYLVDTELRKRAPGAMDFRFGCQEGVIATLSIMFGNADDLIAEIAYEKEESWLQVTERIVDQKLSSWASNLDQLSEEEDFSIDYEQMSAAIDKAVNEFALENPTLLNDALHKNL